MTGNRKENLWKEKIMKIRKTICSLLLVCLTFLGIFAGRVNVYADQKQALSATVTLLKQEKDCVVQVEAKNTGADFTGKVRLVFSGTDNSSGCAFEQCLTLPQNGKKQYTMTIPYADVSQTRGNGIVAFVDEKGNVVTKEAFASIFGKEKRGIGVGVLSDHYDALGWMSMSGQTYYLHGKDQNVYLTQMDADTLQTQLDELYFLVIDSYDVSSLGKENIKAIEKWVKNGGWLLIGTGERVKDTLGGFDSSSTQISYGNVSKPGEENDAQKDMQLRKVYMGFEGMNFTKMSVATLQCSDANAYASDVYPGWVRTCGDGALGVCAISFGEKQLQKASSDLCYGIYDQVAEYSVSYSQYVNDEEWGWNGKNTFGVVDHANTALDFSWLKILIVIYVIVVGPVLYLLLRKMKKRDWYWLGVPVLGILFIGVVFIGGRNLKLHEARVYSVTAQPADGKDTAGITTYYNAYHSGVKPWKVRLNDNYTYGGTGLSESYSMASSGRAYADRYHYVAEYDNGLSLGGKPQSNFENAYLFAAGTAKGCGSIDTSDLVLTQQKQGGSITNNTSYDFPYLVCVSDDTVMVFSDVKAKETITIDGKSKKPLLSQQISYFDDVYNVLSEDNMNGNTYSYKHKDMAAALYLGLCQIRRQNDVSGAVVVEGVTGDYGKTIKSRCSEISFGCLYTIAGQEVSNASN